MRPVPPHSLIRHRLLLLVGAIAAWAIATVLLVFFKSSHTVPTVQLVAGAAMAFVWLNGAFWWLELRYPHMEVAPGSYASRAEQSTGFIRAYSGMIFVAYGLGAVLVTATCLRLVAYG
jgi:hypothetical protein